MKNRMFIIECELPERWVNDFCFMLKTMEFFGQQGHSGVVGIYSDGDVDFRPSFNIQTQFEKTVPLEKFKPNTIYDAD